MKTPIPAKEDFIKKVEDSEKIYGIPECVYEQCISAFNRIEIRQLNETDTERIIKPFLLTWGNMGRVLGNQGVKAICKKIMDISEEIEPLRKKDFLSENLMEIKGKVIKLFDEIRKATFKNQNGKEKEIRPTAASKVLHLVCPDLFIMWDTDIRRGYEKKRNDGNDYFEFLDEIKNEIYKNLEYTIKDLQQKHGKKVTRIIDQYNWMTFHKKS